MIRDEVLMAIGQTIGVIRTYRQERTAKRASARELLEEVKVDEASRRLIKESFMLLPGDTPCPRCGGSGTV